MTLTALHFPKNNVRGHVPSVPGQMRVKFEVRGFNRFGEVVCALLYYPKCAYSVELS